MADSTDAVSSNPSASDAENHIGGPAPLMEGFGNDYYMTSLNYGSVNDGALYQPTLEQKLKKQYWKTKQAVIQKLGKSQDEFVVAGDAEIDTKLEKAYHLQTSCAEVLDTLEHYAAHVQALSSNEQSMGEYLRAYSEDEPTQASSVMKAVGVVQEKVAKQRMEMLPSLLRLHNEFVSFLSNALTDLSQSIQRLEKARTDYRAALLWMRDVSAKLQNPDHRDELVKFRQVQAQVKDAKKVFERLKYDMAEKIDMVAASRCNLISCSLPYYQKALLGFLDHSATEYHSVLETLRTYNRDQHQYQERKLIEEIRDLELGEPMASDPQSPVHPPAQSHRPALQGSGGAGEEDDEMLLDVGSAQTPSGAPSLPGGDVGVVKAKDTPPPQAVVDELKDLLKMDDELLMLGGMEDLTGGEPPRGGDGAGRGGEEDEWGNFSSFMQDSTEESISSDWEKEFAVGVGGTGPQTETTADELLMSSEQWQQPQPPPTMGAQSIIRPSASNSGVESSKMDASAILPGEGKPSSVVFSSPTKSKPTDGTTAPLQTQPPLPTESAHTLLEVEGPLPRPPAGSEPNTLQELLGIDLSLTGSSSTLPPPMLPYSGTTPLSATLVRTTPQSVAPVNTAPLNVVPLGTAPQSQTPHADTASLNGTLNLASLSTAPLSMASLNAAWSMGSPRPADAHPPPNIGGSAVPVGAVGPFQPVGVLGPFHPMGTVGPFQPVGMGGSIRPAGMTGPVWPGVVSGPPPLHSTPMGTGTLLPFQPALTHAKPLSSAGAAGPKHKEGSKGNTTAWMSVFAHLDPLVNEKA